MPDLSVEDKKRQLDFNKIAGVDEAGRGPWAGPVYSAAVILNRNCIPEGINDSKKISEKKRSQIGALLKSMKLEDRANTKAKFLSGGEKRKTEILRAILLDAKYILLDEPFAGVDPISVEEIIKLLDY